MHATSRWSPTTPGAWTTASASPDPDLGAVGGSDRIDTERLQLCFEIEESTTLLLLSSIDGARRQFVRDGREPLDRAVRSAALLRERLAAEVPELRAIGRDELAARPASAASTRRTS